jgi:hypothetical protein
MSSVARTGIRKLAFTIVSAEAEARTVSEVKRDVRVAEPCRSAQDITCG